MTLRVDLNADAGESFGAWTLGDDEALFGFVSSANVACGFHAGDPLTIERTLEIARRTGTAVGAHPGYRDLEGFGRRVIEASFAEVRADVLYQVGAFAAFARAAGLPLHHVKAHGAMTNRAWQHADTARAIAQAVLDFDASLPLVVQPGTLAESEARALGARVVLEGFPERAYLRNGQLAPRSMAGSSIHDPREAARRAVAMVTQGRVECLDGGVFELRPETLCVHGDNPHAPEIARAVRLALEAEGVTIGAF